MTFCKRFSLLGFIGYAVMASSAQATAAWSDDLPKAQAQAKAEGKFVLIHFSGSDWCGWCMKLRKEVFLKPEFESYARSNLLLLDAQGSSVGRLSYGQGGPKAFLAEVEKIIHPQPELPPAKILAKKNADSKRSGRAPDAGEPAKNDLTLKRISGPKQRRQALINNQTFPPGKRRR